DQCGDCSFKSVSDVIEGLEFKRKLRKPARQIAVAAVGDIAEEEEIRNLNRNSQTVGSGRLDTGDAQSGDSDSEVEVGGGIDIESNSDDEDSNNDVENFTPDMLRILESFESYKLESRTEYCLSHDNIIDLRTSSLFLKYAKRHHEVSGIKTEVFKCLNFRDTKLSEPDKRYHDAARTAFDEDSKKSTSRIQAMSEPEFTQVVLRPLLSWPFCQESEMHWCGSEPFLFSSAKRRNSSLNLYKEKVQVGHKADGIVRLMNHDKEGYEVLVLEVSGEPYVEDSSKYAMDFYKLGRELKDCFDGMMSKIRQAGKSTNSLKHKLGIIGIQCHAYDMEISAFVKFQTKQFIVPLFHRKVPRKVLKLDSQLNQIEKVMLGIKDYFCELVALLETIEENETGSDSSPRIFPTVTTPKKQKKDLK
ncbi:hypothetical protein HDU82_002987, partial [Entophlyctis luteolus]